MGQFKVAQEYFRKSLQVKKSLFDEKHPDIAASYSYLAISCSNMGDYVSCMRFFLKSYRINKRLYHEKHPELKKICRNITLIYQSLDDNQKSLVGNLKSYKKLKKLFKKHGLLPRTEEDINTSRDSLYDDQISSNENFLELSDPNMKRSNSTNPYLTKLLYNIEKSHNCLIELNKNLATVN